MTTGIPKDFNMYQIEYIGDKGITINYKYDYGMEINDEGDLTID